jgi:hypothetical protein
VRGPQRGPHRQGASKPAWPASVESPPQQTPVPFGSTLSGRDASPGPLNGISAQAYRARMSPLNNSLAPNPRLQRTRSAPLRSPLNRKPFGGPS